MLHFTEFMPILNAVSGKRQIRGVLTLETKDKNNGWVFSYEDSKPLFEEWSAEINNATSGKSYGNVRLMHSMTAVGKISKPLEFDDANKKIYSTIDITDDKVWTDICNGVYCGLSFSGFKVPPTPDILSKWSNIPDGHNRYIGRPLEVSIVDNPNQPGANFEVVNSAGKPTFQFEKENGEVELREFKLQGENKMEKLTPEEIQNAAKPEIEKLLPGAVKIAVDASLPEAVTNAVKAALTPEAITNAVKATVDAAVKEAVTNAVAGLNIPTIQANVQKIMDSTPEVGSIVTKVIDSLQNGGGTQKVEDNFDAKAVANAAGLTSEEDIKAIDTIHKINNGTLGK